MLPRIKHAVDEYWKVKGSQPRYIGLGQLEIEALRDYLNNDLSLKRQLNVVSIKYGLIYGVHILPVDRETFFEVL